MGRNAHGQRVQPGAGQQRNRAVGASGQDQRHRPRPEGFGQFPRTVVEDDDVFGRSDTAEMDDQRIEGRAVLGREDGRGGRVVGGIGAETVDGFRRKGDELPGAEQRRGLRDGGVTDGGNPGLGLGGQF